MNYEIGLAHTYNNGPLTAKTSFTAQFFDNLHQSMDIWRENFGQSEVTNIGSAPINLTEFGVAIIVKSGTITLLFLFTPNANNPIVRDIVPLFTI